MLSFASVKKKKSPTNGKSIIGVAATASPTGRVLGGHDATEGQFPHQVSLRRNDSHSCGGSIISRNFVLTAAHCVGTLNSEVEYYTYDPSDFTVRAGSSDHFQGGVLVNVTEIIAHEDYGNFLNDVALLRLAEPLIFSENIQPIPLATTEVPAGSPVIISGFGRIQHGGDMPEKLQWNTLTALSCSESEEMFHLDTDDVICLDHEANNGLCFGGPAVYNGEVVGIGSFLFGYCGNSYPDGYTKVFYHSEWIRKHSDL